MPEANDEDWTGIMQGNVFSRVLVYFPNFARHDERIG
jgi:hypothetical protein